MLFSGMRMHPCQHVQNAQHHRDALCNDRCHRCAPHAHANPGNEPQVQPTFSTELMSRNTSGITLLPMARSRPAHRLS